MSTFDLLSFTVEVARVAKAGAPTPTPWTRVARSLAIRAALVGGVTASVLAQHVAMPQRLPCPAVLAATVAQA